MKDMLAFFPEIFLPAQASGLKMVRQYRDDPHRFTLPWRGRVGSHERSGMRDGVG
jgi:hypothetical protein